MFACRWSEAGGNYMQALMIRDVTGRRKIFRASKSGLWCCGVVVELLFAYSTLLQSDPVIGRKRR
jgi:hypothetical protein